MIRAHHHRTRRQMRHCGSYLALPGYQGGLTLQMQRSGFLGISGLRYPRTQMPEASAVQEAHLREVSHASLNAIADSHVRRYVTRLRRDP